MEIVDILFVVIGLICVAASFFLPERLSGGAKKEEQRTADLKEAVLAELRKKENLDRIVSDALSELSGRMREQKNELLLDSEAELDRMSNEKILAFGEYSDEVTEKIEQNHREVVFLYDMLKEKESDLKDFAARLEGTGQQLQLVLQETRTESDRLHVLYQQVQELSIQVEESRRRQLREQAAARKAAGHQPSGRALSGGAALEETAAAGYPVRGGMQRVSEQPGTPEQGMVRASAAAGQAVKRNPAQSRGRAVSSVSSPRREQVPASSGQPLRGHQTERNPQEMTEGEEPSRAVVRRRADTSLEADERIPVRRQAVKRRPAPKPLENPVELLSEEEQEEASLEERNDRILRMYRGGMSILEISRAMGLGQGEVKLVIDLFHR